MVIFQRIRSRLYFQQEKRSDRQLAEDFGEFPPFPLNCRGLEREFMVVRTRPLGGVWLNIQLFKRLLQVKSPDEIDASLHGVWQELQDVRNKVVDAFSGLSGVGKTTSERVIFALVSVSVLLVVSPLLVPFLLFRILLLLVNLHRRSPIGFGYYAPLFVNEGRIVIKANMLAKRTDSDEVISHEHLHLLQHRNGSADNKRLNCRDTLLDSASQDNGFVLYLLQKHEVEARLHEIVLSHYRVNRELPLTLGGFIEMLSISQCVGPLVCEAIGPDEISVARFANRYHVRSSMIGAQFQRMLASIRNVELRRRFITEVLTVMYGNLLRYYGDQAASRLFMQGMVRPNLHDSLYD